MRFALASVLGIACTSSPSDTCDGAVCRDGGGDGQQTDAPANCDLSKDPKDSPACVDSSVGVFVDATNGKDSNPGTKTSPMQTIGAALGKTGTVKRIYVCEGTYAEDVTIDASHDGVSIYGGWKCADWTYSGGKPQLGKTSLALVIDSLTKPISIEDVLVKAADNGTSGGSSIAAFVKNGATVQFTRVNLTAGAGKDGTPGTLTTLTYPNPATDLQGNPATDGNGAAAKSYACPGGGGTTTGGKGGDGSGGDGDPGLPANGGGAKGLGGAQSIACTVGSDGNAGAAGPDGASPTNVGTLSATGWQPSKGHDGTVGVPGQGGGGGGGRTFNAVSGGGGSGGAGGCGGAGALGGQGGGGSIALAVFNSTVAVSSSELHATTVGNGGAGVAGQPGQTTSGVHGNGFSAGCAGGNGAAGGNGGAGAGGAGGVSVGVLWKGSAAPTVDSATTSQTTFGTKGSKGAGGNSGVNDGVDGVAQAVLQSP